jgi:hypothetical protein
MFSMYYIKGIVTDFIWETVLDLMFIVGASIRIALQSFVINFFQLSGLQLCSATRKSQCAIFDFYAGLPDGLFSNQKSQFG